MRTPPNDLDIEAISAILSAHWEIDRATLSYVPLGFGSHHWAAEGDGAGRWFVTVDDLRADHLVGHDRSTFDVLATAFGTAASLRDLAHLPFVVGPVATTNGEVIVRLDAHYSVAVFPYLAVEPTEFGEFRNPQDRNEALNLVGEIHNATDAISIDGLRRDTLVIPGRPGLLRALESLAEPWTGGPFSEPARRLLQDNVDTLLKKLHRFDDLARSAMRDATGTGWVVTYGEPHTGNVIRTRTGALVMVDWDSVAYAPRERDLWMLVNEGDPDWLAYRDVTGVASPNDDVIEAYRLHWDVSEIAVYVSWFMRPHERTEDTETAWSGLRHYLSGNS